MVTRDEQIFYRDVSSIEKSLREVSGTLRELVDHLQTLVVGERIAGAREAPAVVEDGLVELLLSQRYRDAVRNLLTDAGLEPDEDERDAHLAQLLAGVWRTLWVRSPEEAP